MLVIVAAVSAVVAPRLERTLDAVTGSGERAEVVRQLERLPLLARHSAVRLTIAPGDSTALASALDIPTGWKVTPETAVLVEASGLCAPARLRISRGDAVEAWVLTEPACEVHDAP